MRFYPRPRPRPVTIGPTLLAALILVIGACGAPDDTERTEPDTGSEAGSDSGPDGGSEQATGADSPGTLGLSDEEGPAPDPGPFSERLETSGYATEASRPERAVLAADGCTALAETLVDQYQGLLDELGPAARDDTAAIDRAFESSLVSGPVISGRANEVGCGPDQLGHALCSSLDRLQAHGPAGTDVVNLLGSRCT